MVTREIVLGNTRVTPILEDTSIDDVFSNNEVILAVRKDKDYCYLVNKIELDHKCLIVLMPAKFRTAGCWIVYNMKYLLDSYRVFTFTSLKDAEDFILENHYEWGDKWGDD